MKTPIARRLILSFLSIVILSGAMSVVLGVHLVNGRIFQEAQEKVRNDLNSAREIYISQIKAVKDLVRFTADRYTIRSAATSGSVAQEYDKLKRIKEEEGLDVLTLTDRVGNVVLRVNNPAISGDNLSHDEIIKRALALKQPVASTELVPSSELQKESAKLVEQAFFKFVDTPKARFQIETSQASGMMISAAAPVLDFQNRLCGAVYGGILLNRNYLLVDKIKQTVFQGMKYNGKDIGTATIFQDDVRISTNVLTGAGQRAVGTRVAANVYDQVVGLGKPWIDRAFVVNSWYITAYEPIRDLNGAVLGILYVGILEEKYSDIRRQTIVTFLGLTTLSLVMASVISYFLSRNISRSIAKLVHASREMAAGNLNTAVEIKAKDELGELAGTFNFMASALRERDRQLKEYAQNKIMESERLALIGQLAAGVAHEINNPLQGILSYSCLLVENSPADDPNRGFLEKISQQARRCRDIIRGLLDFSRDTKPQMVSCQMNSVLLESLSLLERQALFQNIMIVREIDPSLPPTILDPSQMQQVFMNIILNAAEAMEGRGTLTLVTRTASSNGFIEIEITDTGAGISKENLEKIFDPFFTTKQVGQGTGLGLAISYGIVKKHNGNIEVRSEIGKGTSFFVRLPIVAEAEKEQGHAGES
jgi:two-component system NtrC family sensor kinase